MADRVNDTGPEKSGPLSRPRRIRDKEKQREYTRNSARKRRAAPKGKEEHAAYMREWNRKNPDRAKSIALKKAYGITLEDYNRMLDEQGGVCAICKGINKDSRRLAVDHCHETGKVRGLLCSNCNVAIGHLRHDPALLEQAIGYLRKDDPAGT